MDSRLPLKQNASLFYRQLETVVDYNAQFKCFCRSVFMYLLLELQKVADERLICNGERECGIAILPQLATSVHALVLPKEGGSLVHVYFE